MEITKVEIELVEIPERVANYVEKNSLKEIINNINWVNKNIDSSNAMFSYLSNNFEKVLNAKINGYVVEQSNHPKKYVIKLPLLAKCDNIRDPLYLSKAISIYNGEWFDEWALTFYKDSADKFTLDEIRSNEELAPLEKFAVPVEDMEDK